MRTLTLIVALLVASAALGQTFNPGRKYAEGTKDRYTTKFSAKSSVGDILLSSDLEQTVKKVYANGDADVEGKQENLKITVGGQEISAPASSSSMKIDKFGRVLSAPSSRGPSFSRYAGFLGDKPLAVGASFSYDEQEKDSPKNHVKGTVKLLSLNEGKAVLSVTIDRFVQGVDKPMHVEGTVTVEAESGRLISFLGTAKDVPSMGQGPSISTAEFSMERKG